MKKIVLISTALIATIGLISSCGDNPAPSNRQHTIVTWTGDLALDGCEFTTEIEGQTQHLFSLPENLAQTIKNQNTATVYFDNIIRYRMQNFVCGLNALSMPNIDLENPSLQ